MPNPEDGTEVRYHEFTDAQLETIKPALDQIQQAQQFVGFFLGYVQKEAKLPESLDGWILAPSPATGKPAMKGRVKKG